MMTIVSRVRVKEGEAPAWDEAFRERAAAASKQPGFVTMQLCMPVGALDERVVIGTWQTRADWEAWHNDPTFVETRGRLEQTDDEKTYEEWYEVVLREG
jgi:heme-degrading monooxygenase HmoA